MPAQPLSPQQLADAANLKQLFIRWQNTRKSSGLPASQEAAAELMGFGQSALAQYLNGKIPLNVDAGLKFSQLLGAPVAAFSQSIGDQAAKMAEAVALSHREMFRAYPGLMQVSGEDDEQPPTIAISMVSLHIQAGIDGMETVPVPDDGGRLHVPRQWLEENDFSPNSLIAVKIKGESMQTTMFDGDIAVINTADKTRQSGSVFALNFNGQAVIKRLKYDRREWYLTSDNPEFRPEACRGADCMVIGRVVRFEPRNFRDRL